jgi:hypothetical protein
MFISILAVIYKNIDLVYTLINNGGDANLHVDALYDFGLLSFYSYSFFEIYLISINFDSFL